ncbi:MAG: ribbon-helix-helix domain-containing protein [Pararhodobacter sp.]
MSRPEKQSLTLRGHRTSVSLEPAFWAAFRALAKRRGQSLNDCAAEIDANRGDQGLATAIRLAVLHDLQSRRPDGEA